MESVVGEQGIASGLVQTEIQFGTALLLSIGTAVNLDRTGDGGGKGAIEGYHAALWVPLAAGTDLPTADPGGNRSQPQGKAANEAQCRQRGDRRGLTKQNAQDPQGGDMSSTVPNVISRYFELDEERDIKSIVDLFAENATVVDEGEARHGRVEIHAWQVGPASRYTYTIEVLNTELVGPDRYRVSGHLTGNFPGGTADLKWDFTIADERIASLVIAP